MKYKIGVCQFKPKFLDTTYNLEQMKSLVGNIQADLIVLPELATSGYFFNSKKQLITISEDAYQGQTADLFLKLAKKNKTSYVVGFSEKFKDKIFNSSMLVNPNGDIHVYRKTHLFYEETKWFNPGNTGFKVFNAKDNVKVGMMICFDWIFPESARSLALNGAQIIAHPANLVLPWCQQAMITRSLENRVFSITANRIGNEQNDSQKLTFTGLSQMLNTKGEVLKKLNKTEESVHLVSIDPEKADDKSITEYNNAFGDRRTEYYNL